MNTDINDFKGLKVTVMGLGINGGGLASAVFLAEQGAQVTVTDLRDETVLAPSIEALKNYPIRYVLGRHETDDFAKADLVIKNPGVRPDNPFLAAARNIDTDISIFLKRCPARIIAVTGSKGKSSTVSAIHHILSRSGLSSYLGGNITRSPLTFLHQLKADDWVVLELSSWQLGDLRGKSLLKPHCAVLTHIVPDHLDRYGTMEAYIADKRLIYAHQSDSDWTVCENDAWGRSFAGETRAKVLMFGESKTANQASGWLQPDGSGMANLPEQITLVPAQLRVPGRHNRLNCLAAALAAWTTGLPAASISQALESFPGVEHRLELFAEKDGIRWCNDSAATVPEAVEAAVAAFADPVVLITGGTDKVLDFTASLRACAKAKAVVLLAGTGSEKLKRLLEADGLPYHGPFDKLAAALDTVTAISQAGDTVLLSPGCTSFGMFKNEFDRGNSFKQAVLARLQS